MIKNTLLFILIPLLMVFPFLASHAQDSLVNKAYANKTVLFAGFAGKFLPIVPIEPISTKDNLNSHLEAEYDSAGRLVVVTRFLEGKKYFVQKIKYNGSEIGEITVEDAEGKVTRQANYTAKSNSP